MINLISLGINNGPPPEGADIYIDCRQLFDPSPVVQDLPGIHPETRALVINSTPAAPALIETAAHAAHRIDQLAGTATIAAFCNAGYHRSVAVIETIARVLEDNLDHARTDLNIAHRDLGGAP